MRELKHISIHCTDSDVPAHDNVEVIRQWHTLPKIPKDVVDKIKKGLLPKSTAYQYGNGWKDIGYHWIILKNGDIAEGRPMDVTPAAVGGHNTGMIAIALTGRNKFSEAQFKSLKRLIKKLMFEHNIGKSYIKGHNEYAGHETRGCPNFNVDKVLWDE